MPGLPAFLFVLLMLFIGATPPAVAQDEVQILQATAFALRGQPKYQEGFSHFDYVNPDAPFGGTLRRHATGTFDSLNRYGQRGSSAAGADEIYDTLLVASQDELDVYYPLVAERMEYASDYSFVDFYLHPEARFQDGRPIRPQDIKFSFEKFASEGVPQFKRFYGFVQSIEALDRRRVRFNLEGATREEFTALFTLKILPEHFWKDHDLGEPLKVKPIGSSGKRFHKVRFGQFVILENMQDYWARDLPVRRGHNNFKYERFDYFRDETVAFEAFKKGQIDFWQESEAKRWATAYEFPAIEQGEVIRELIPHSIPQGTRGYFFNSGHELFQDYRVRWALAQMLDFEWTNKALFYGQYERTRCFFINTPYCSEGLPEGRELEILESQREHLPPALFEQPYEPRKHSGDGNIRPAMRHAITLLDEAGWELRQGQMVNRKTGKPFRFELMFFRPSSERPAAAFRANLARIGIEVELRSVDSSQFLQRVRNHGFEMVDSGYPATPTPSSSHKIFFRSNFLDSSWNTAHVQNPAIDYLIDGVLASQEDEQALLAWGRALDRALMWNHYWIPHWHLSAFRIAYKDQFGRPQHSPRYALGLDTWWLREGSADSPRPERSQ